MLGPAWLQGWTWLGQWRNKVRHGVEKLLTGGLGSLMKVPQHLGKLIYTVGWDITYKQKWGEVIINNRTRSQIEFISVRPGSVREQSSGCEHRGPLLWTFSAHMANICTWTRGRLCHLSEPCPRQRGLGLYPFHRSEALESWVLLWCWHGFPSLPASVTGRPVCVLSLSERKPAWSCETFFPFALTSHLPSFLKFMGFDRLYFRVIWLKMFSSFPCHFWHDTLII